MANLRETYLSLGRHVRGAQLYDQVGITGVTSSFDHAIGNFGVAMGGDRTAAFEAWRLARDHESYLVYVGQSEPEFVPDAVFCERGFRPVHRQCILVQSAEDFERTSDPLCVLPVEGRENREAVADFVSRQFFSQVSPVVRDEVARVITRAESLDLFGTWDPLTHKTFRNIQGAYSICDTEMLGLYNLCVDVRLRGQGVGSFMVRKLLESRSGRQICLQCDESLLSWYQQFGLQQVGWLGIYSLRRA